MNVLPSRIAIASAPNSGGYAFSSPLLHDFGCGYGSMARERQRDILPDGLRFIFTSFASNFANFTMVGVSSCR